MGEVIAPECSEGTGAPEGERSQAGEGHGSAGAGGLVGGRLTPTTGQLSQCPRLTSRSDGQTHAPPHE
jgi:hypothetical protein